MPTYMWGGGGVTHIWDMGYEGQKIWDLGNGEIIWDMGVEFFLNIKFTYSEPHYY